MWICECRSLLLRRECFRCGVGDFGRERFDDLIRGFGRKVLVERYW